jgi:RsiW-degrading membrane proteinase PrsW (M82 family)
VCCVCERPLTGRARLLGGRPYCAEHYARAILGRRAHRMATAALLAGLLALVLVMLAVGPRISGRLGTHALVLVGLVLAILPALLWLGVFYQQDRLEPEPKRDLLSVLVLAALLTGTIGEPLRRDFFALPHWQPPSALAAILVETLIPGAIQALIVYVAVRVTVFPAREFDERADGVIYGTAAGLGVATLLNFNYVLDQRGLALDVGAVRIVVAALVQAALGGVVGYGLGQVKFERHWPGYAAAFVLLAALLGGIFAWLEGEATGQSLRYRAWPGAAVATLYAVGVGGFLAVLLRRAVAETLARAGGPAAPAEE